MSRRAATIVLSDQERGDLEGLLRRRRTAQGLALRARIVLLASQGLDNKTIAARTGAVENTVGKWRRRFAQARVDGLFDEPRPGRPREIGDEEIAETVRLTLETTPKNATHWSLRSMAQGGRPFAIDHSPHLVGVLPAAASHRDIQAFDRSAFCRESARHCRPLHGSAGPRDGVVR